MRASTIRLRLAFGSMEWFMTCDDTAYDDDADFQRWYFGGSPPENDDWPRHAFEDSLQGAAAGTARVASAPMTVRMETPAQFAMA